MAHESRAKIQRAIATVMFDTMVVHDKDAPPSLGSSHTVFAAQAGFHAIAAPQESGYAAGVATGPGWVSGKAKGILEE